MVHDNKLPQRQFQTYPSPARPAESAENDYHDALDDLLYLICIEMPNVINQLNQNQLANGSLANASVELKRLTIANALSSKNTPESFLSPLIRIIAYESRYQANRQMFDLAIATFGRQRVQEMLYNYSE